MGPAQLAQVLRGLPPSQDKNLLIGLASSDDAGVYQIAPNLALVQTVDFFTPIVDDPYLFGQIAATNSLSDVYAMGGRPITAMNILCYPIKERDPLELAQILKGGAEKVAEAGAALAGGHSVEDSEPKFGLSVTGLIDPQRIASNAGAKPGDVIVLTKPLGTGIITTAAKLADCPADVLAYACKQMATLNAGAAAAMRETGIGADSAVHAATDITGFGVVGHLYQLARASGVGIEIDSAALPELPSAVEFAKAGYLTRGDRDNRAYLGDLLRVGAGIADERLSLLLDPQTSGGLAICVAEASLDALLENLKREGVETRAVIGRVVASDSPVLSIL